MSNRMVTKIKATAPRRGAPVRDAAMTVTGGSSIMIALVLIGGWTGYPAQTNPGTSAVAMQGKPRRTSSIADGPKNRIGGLWDLKATADSRIRRFGYEASVTRLLQICSHPVAASGYFKTPALTSIGVAP